MPEDSLPHQRAFVEEYLKLRQLNGALAARRAGVPAKSAKQMASRWLADPLVRAELTAARDAIRETVYTDAATVTEELLIIGKSDISEVCRVDKDGRLWLRSDIPEHAWRAIKSITFKYRGPKGTIKTKKFSGDDLDEAAMAAALGLAESENTLEVKVEMHDKPKALHILASHLGMLNKNINVTGKLSLADVIRASMADE